MTINNPDAFRRNIWDWSILNGCLGDFEFEPLNIDEFLRTLWDWAILDGCFGETRIKPMDIDGSVERRGQILFLETKEPGVELKPPQLQTYETLAQKPGQTVFLIWGHPGKPEAIQALSGRRRSKRYPCDLDILRAWVSHWFKTVDRGGFIHIEDKDLDDQP